MKQAIILQARTGSTRLPNKMNLELKNGLTIPGYIIKKIKERFKNVDIILATSSKAEDDSLEILAEKWDIDCFRGDENNVLKRFIDCTERFKITHLIRVCADNPFLDLDLLEELLQVGVSSESEYCSFELNGIPVIKTHSGVFCEFVTTSALKKIAALTDLPLFCEHVTNYIYTHPETFIINWLSLPDQFKKLSEIRLTVDTMTDFLNVQTILANLEEPINTSKILRYVNQNEYLKATMLGEINANQK